MSKRRKGPNPANGHFFTKEELIRRYEEDMADRDPDAARYAAEGRIAIDALYEQIMHAPVGALAVLLCNRIASFRKEDIDCFMATKLNEVGDRISSVCNARILEHALSHVGDSIHLFEEDKEDDE